MKFKTITIVIIANFIFANTLFSQECYTEKKHEINLGYFNIFELINSHNLGVGYKYHFNQSGVRLNANFDYTADEHTDEYNNDWNGYGYSWRHMDYYVTDYLEYNLKLGYEFHININKFQFYYGADLIYSNLTFNRNYGYIDNVESEIDIIRSVQEHGYGLSPFVGLKYFLNKRISISSETNINVLFQKTNSTYTGYSEINNTIIKNTQSETSIDFSPLGLITINFHL